MALLDARWSPEGRAELWRFLVRYVIVGGSIGLVFLAIGYLLRQAGWNFLTSVVIAFLLTIPLSYVGQRRLVFRSKGTILNQMMRYLLISIIVAGASAAIQQLYSGAGVLAQIAIWALASAANLIGYRFIVFTQREPRHCAAKPN